MDKWRFIMLQRETLIYAECCSSIVPCQLETDVRKVDSSSFALCLLPAFALPRDFLRHPVRVLPRQMRQVVCDTNQSIYYYDVYGWRQYYLFWSYASTPNAKRQSVKWQLANRKLCTKPTEHLLKGLSTVDLLIEIGCFLTKENIVQVWKAADLN
jgi:hypothetical protein